MSMFRNRRLELLAVVLATAGALCAQETRRTITNPSPNPKDDSKANSSAVPDTYALTGQFDRIVVIRLKNKANLLDGMDKVVQGAAHPKRRDPLRRSVHCVATRFIPYPIAICPRQDTYCEESDAAVDLVSMNGYVINGRIHAHMTLATPDRVIAGHVEEGNEVYTYAIVTIGVMNGTNLDKIDDKTYR